MPRQESWSGERSPAWSACQPLDDLPEVLRSGAAATAHQAESELANELFQGVRKLHRLQRVDRPVGRQLRQSGVRHATDADRRVTGEVPQVLAHLRRAGRAVQPDHVDAEWLQRCERGTDLRAEQHGACGLHSHCTITGRSRPAYASARFAPSVAAFVCSRSCEVSIKMASTPPASRPSTCC